MGFFMIDYKSKVDEMILAAKDNAFFIGTTDKRYIDQIETLLEVKLPEEYKWFISKYGHGFVYSVFILGVGKDKSLVCANETLIKRQAGLPKNLVVVENCDEWVYCIDCDNGEVLMWSAWEGISDYCYNSFLEYLLDRIKETVEN